jgi:hypothetical protein
MRRKAFALVCAVLFLGAVWSTSSFGIPMVITGGTLYPESGDPRPISGVVNFLGSPWVQTFSGGFNLVLFADGIEPVVDTYDFSGFIPETQWVTEQEVVFWAFNYDSPWFPIGPDPYGRYIEWLSDLIASYSGEYQAPCGGYDPWPCAYILKYESLSVPHISITGVGTIENLAADAIEYDGMATTRQIYVPEVGWQYGADYYTEMTLGRTIDFDYWWEMYNEPPPYQQGYMFDVLALQGGEGWQYIGQIDTYGSSTDWGTTSLAVPENLWGTETEVRFVLNDYSPQTSPAVYLRDVRTGPVPEPSMVYLIGFGLIGFLALRRRFGKGDE